MIKFISKFLRPQTKEPCSDEEEVGNWDPDDGRHPLLNVVVMTRIFNHFKFKDQRIFRLVCRQWHDIIDGRWRNEMKAVLSCSFDVEWILALNAFAAEDRPYDIYKLEMPLTDQPGALCDSLRVDIMKEFWRCCGDHIRKLELVNCQVQSVPLLRAIIFLPNLEELVLDGLRATEDCREVEWTEVVKVERPKLKALSMSRTQGWDSLQLSWDLIFASFPNIESLQLGTVHFNHLQDYYKTLVETLEYLSRTKNHHVIKCLRLDSVKGTSLDYDDVLTNVNRLLELPQLKLESFGISLDKLVVARDLLYQAFKNHGNTLKSVVAKERELSMIYRHTSFNPSVHWDLSFLDTPMVSLVELELPGLAYEDLLQILEKTPNLKVLRISKLFPEEESSVDVEKLGRGMLLPSLQVLRIGCYIVDKHSVAIPENNIRKFVEVMPNVRDLKAPLGGIHNAFPIVCQHWKQLACLEETSESLNDEGLTGNWEDERKPNITDLKYLKVLKIHSRKLTDVSVWSGFLQMSSHLQSLTVTLSHETSNEAFRLLYYRYQFGRVGREQIPREVPTRIRKKKEKLNDELMCIGNI